MSGGREGKKMLRMSVQTKSAVQKYGISKNYHLVPNDIFAPTWSPSST